MKSFIYLSIIFVGVFIPIVKPKSNHVDLIEKILDYIEDDDSFGLSCELSDSSESSESLESCEKPPCDPNDCICQLDYDPVCGDNDVHYENRCRFNCAQKCNSSLSETPCPCELYPCNCDDNFDPVCGNNGITYKSLCLFYCREKCNPDLKIVNTGICQTPCQPDGCQCSFEYEPLCGCDGIKYSNFCDYVCKANCVKNLTIAYSGECVPGMSASHCPQNCSTPTTTKPKCKSNKRPKCKKRCHKPKC